MEYRETICAAIRTFGDTNQIVVAIEELSELQKELCKLLRGSGDREHIAEEIADVQIMLDQLLHMLELHEMTRTFTWFKIERLQSRIEAEREKREKENGLP